MEDDLWWKTTLDGRQPLMNDNPKEGKKSSFLKFFLGKKIFLTSPLELNILKKSMPMLELHTAPALSRFAAFFFWCLKFLTWFSIFFGDLKGQISVNCTVIPEMWFTSNQKVRRVWIVWGTCLEGFVVKWRNTSWGWAVSNSLSWLPTSYCVPSLLPDTGRLYSGLASASG